ncbi:divergent PAP2 family protein [Cyanobacterium sp. uoEpiScrs1]|uniref:divergent PAP2 family protein n=1 Tax=Cyanobacterium sp. uoEpiScrs1 TaxID=2976343 RepID=UPI002269B81F|nr:divergent PAP2 family protein [Cyanobacterium sp. uoEpiScrs1]
MHNFETIFQNPILSTSLLACFSAQGLKAIIELFRNGPVNLRYLVTTGGMPSSHSALVGALATGVGLTVGWNSPEFAIASLFAVVVMYDAAGVRQAAGTQAKILNQILDEFFHDGHHLNQERLKELLGHTPFQVFAGLAWGVGISVLALPVF